MLESSVDRPLRTPDNVIQFPGQSNPEDEAIEIVIDDGEDQPDYQQEEESPAPQSFEDNLAKSMSDQDLAALALDLLEAVDEDIQSRSDWEKDYQDNLKYLGIKTEKKDTPFQGASNITHPMMLEAIIRFQSRALVKLYPSSGPAAISIKKHKVDITPQIQIEQEKAAAGFNEYLKEIKEMFTETDRLLSGLANIGYAAKKIYHHQELGRCTTQFVKAENFILPYGCDNLETCPRFTEEVRRTQLEVDNLQKSGYYLDIPLVDSMEEMNEVEQAKTSISGQTPSTTLSDGVRIYEIYVDMIIDSDEFSRDKASPYVITIAKDSAKILAVYRNWRRPDQLRKKKVIFVPYIYVAGEGSYGWGLIQLVGQLAKAATNMLRKLDDAATIANIPSWFKSRDVKIKNPGPLAPGEVKPVDCDAETLRNGLIPVPVKPPDATLLALLQLVIEEGKSFAQTADLDISASSQNAPVGTTLALLERQTELQNAVQTRLWNSFTQELQLIATTLEEYDPDRFMDIFGRLEQIAGKGNFEIVAAADPTAATMAQKVIQLQGIAQMAVTAPQVYDMAALHRSIISAMGITEASILVPDKSQSQPMGLVEEQMAFITGKPVQCYPFYDHKAHITAHMALLNDPLYQQIFSSNPAATQIVAAIHADIAQHIAYDYRNQIEEQLGTQLPPVNQPQPPQVDAALSQLVAKASQRVAQQHAAQAQQMQAAQQQADPAYQLEKRELDIKQQKLLSDHAIQSRKLDQADKAQDDKKKLELLRIDAGRKQAEDAGQRDIAKSLLEDDRERSAMAQETGHRLLDHAEHLNDLDMQQQQLEQQADLAKQAPPQQPS